MLSTRRVTFDKKKKQVGCSYGYSNELLTK